MSTSDFFFFFFVKLQMYSEIIFNAISSLIFEVALDESSHLQVVRFARKNRKDKTQIRAIVSCISFKLREIHESSIRENLMKT